MSEATDIDIAKVFETCADKWESGQWGWTQKRYYVPDPNASEGFAYCALGGLRQVITEGRIPQNGRSKYDLLYRAQLILQSKTQSIVPVPVWNDKPFRTMNDVIELFKNTAKEICNEHWEAA